MSNIVSLFRQQAKKTPGNIAVAYKDKQYTYAEVDALSDRIAAHINYEIRNSKFEIQNCAEPVVSILIPRSEWMAIASLGVLKAGCAFQPLDPSYPKERLNFMMQDAGATLLIADEELLPLVNEYRGEVLLTKDLKCPKDPKDPRDLKDPAPDSLFILLYTSGSTGVPKGCMLTHRNLVAFCDWYRRYYDLQPTDRVAAYASFGFDACMMDLYPALTTGAAVHIIPEEIRLDLVALNEYFEQHHITLAFMTTQVGCQFAEMDNHSLRHLSVGGESFIPVEPPKNFQLHNAYGPTECTIFTTVYPIHQYEKNAPIGKPLDSFRLYVVDQEGHPVEEGREGELWVSGPQVARGYLGRPELNAQVFTPNPFCQEPDYDRVYHTGDIVRLLPDGNLQFIGRRDGQVKIRGFRIEMREVEGVIKEFPGIKDVTVQAFDEEGGGKFIAAYVVSDSRVDIEALNAFILERKPPYMVPAATMQIPAIPLNQNQKVDKRALPKPEKSSSSSLQLTPPQNDLQRELMERIAKIIHNTEFGIDTPLRYVGLTSISAIRLAATVYKQYGVALDAKSLVKEATILMMEQQINDCVNAQLCNCVNAGAAATNTITQSHNNAITTAPLSFSQTGVYVDCINNPDDTQYNIPWVLGFPADTDTEHLRRAVLTVLEAHKHIFVHFEADGDDIVQRYAPATIEIPILSLTDTQLAEHKQAFVRPFDLNEDVLCRMEIAQTGSGVFLLLDFHHLVFDGSSLDLFIVQLCSALEGSAVEPESYSHLNHAADEQQAPIDDHKAYYDNLLGSCEGATELPSDLPNPHECLRSAELYRPIDMGAVEQFCREHPVTPAHLTLAATLLAFARFTGNDDLYISTVSSGRSNIRIQNTFGMFVNTLPFAYKFENRNSKFENGTVLDFILDVSQRFDEAMRHEQYPFARIAADYGYTPELAFAYQLGMVTRYMQNGHEVSVESLETGAPKFRLTVRIEIHGAQPCIVTEYDDGQYSRSLVEQLTLSIANILKSFVNRPQAPLADLSLLSPDQTRLLDSFNETDVPYDDSQTIVSLFRRQAKATPDKTALVFKDKQFTYAQLDALTDRIAAHIVGNTITQSHNNAIPPVVSILIPRSEWMAIASLGVLKAGCAFQPLDPSYPKERLNFMMQDAGARLLIADEELLPLVDEYRGGVLLTKDLLDPKDPRDLRDPAPDSLFTLIYTSGTTGTPKGGMSDHRNWVAFCHAHLHNLAITSQSRVAAYASFGFDASPMEIFSSLIAGAELHIVPEELRLDLVALNEYFEQHRITHTFMTTQVAYQFASSIENHSLQYLMTGGEKLSAITPPQNFTLVNAYGPSETICYISSYPVREKEVNIPIGPAMQNCRLYIVDPHGHRLPAGALGELWVSGPQVGRGYLNRPEKTAEAFISNPFSSNPKYNRVYRTGDIVRYLPSGDIQFVGRSDGQVKIRGFRVELKEVEAVIRDFPAIKDATVQAFDEPGGGKFIAAYIVSDAQIDIDALNNFILEQKPPYMVPAVTMQIPSIPLNQNQKVNKRALPKPENEKLRMNAITQSHNNAITTAPLNILEQELQQMIAGIVSNSDFGITTPLAYTGLTSISAIKLAVQVNKRFGVTLNSKTLVKTSTLQSIENEILNEKMGSKSRRVEESKSQTAEPLQETAVQKRVGLSFAQQGVYAECQAHPDSVQYNIPFALRFPKEITEEQLAQAVRQVVDAHPYILCHFAPDGDGTIVQEPISDFSLEIPVGTLTAAEFETYKKSFVRPFDLAKGPCVRFRIVRTDGLNLLADMHHLVSDGASVDLFISQLCNALDGSPVEKEDYSYYDFVRDEEVDPDTEQFFDRQMAPVEEATQLIPDIFEQNLPHTQRSVEVATDIHAVRELAQHHGLTPAAVYLGACFVTFGRYVSEDLVSIVTISNGRSNIKVSNTMGMFVNTLPLVTTLDGNEKTTDFLRRVSQTLADTLDHERYPFARIASRHDFHPQISYAYQIGVMDDHDIRFGPVTTETLTLDIAKLPVAVYIEGSEERAVIKVDYDSALYSQAMMEGLARSINNVLSSLLNPQFATLNALSLTGPEEWHLLDAFNAPWDLDYDHSDTVVSAFRRNAQMQPDKVAAVFKDKTFTYRELDDLTDRIAARIVGNTITQSHNNAIPPVVSILLNRNENVFILPLAAIKAGLAYEPLDPSYPKERLNFMVKDAGACLLLAEESLLGLVDEYTGPTVTVEELYNSAAPEPCDPPEGPKPEDLFIMLYTSGSTGKPKGCQIEHRNMVAYAHGVRNSFYRRDDRIAAYASFGFDVNMSDIFCTLLNGGTVFLIPEEIRMNLDALAAYFDEAGITALLLTTQVGVQFLQNYPQLKTLRMLVMGGEKLPAVDPSRLSYTIYNGYGPTENCCGVSLFPIRQWEPNIPIGKPMGTIHGYVLDKSGHRLPAGAAGEYCLSGPQVSRGYLNRPEKTAEAYEASPFDEFRLYHTGDIVRYRQNGDVEFVGRKDGQVKIRGFRIETKEVEAVIRGYGGIRDVTVQAYDYEGGGKYLAAFVVSEETVDMDALRAYIKSQKPAYMVPAAIVQIEKIPLTVNQKVDKKALPEPKLQKAEYVAPQGKAEEDFCAVFEEVLGVERVSAEDDFFEAGGNSILAMKVVVAAGKRGYCIVYNDVFQNTTPRALAAFLNEELRMKNEESAAAPATNTITQSHNNAITTAPALPETGRDGYNYADIHALLARNTLEAFQSGERTKLCDVLLFGATGYLGSHVLRELLVGHDVHVWCFVRPGRDESGERRLRERLGYYFGESLESLIATRVTVVEGDATDEEGLRSFRAPAKGMTVINCAASVKHFAKGNEIERTNVGSVKNIAEWCERNDARLVHISTGSVTGCRENNIPPKGYRLDEHRLYAGQELESNQYIHSKFMAERHIYEEMLEHGLKAKVMRVGNLAPRAQDGEFQVNYTSNNYMNSLQAYQALGFIPYDALVEQTEFSPIDALAKAILALSTTPDDCVCFMPMNSHRPLMGDIIRELSALGKPIQGVEEEAFGEALGEALTSEAKSQAVSPLIAYNNNAGLEPLGLEGCNCDFTNRILQRLGFCWPETGSAYIRQFIERLAAKGFFKC